MTKQTLMVFLILLIFYFDGKAQYNFQVAFPNLNFSSALDLQNAGDGSDRIFVVERGGSIKVFPNQQNVSTTKIFLNISDRITSGGETGLLGLAFHPDYKNNGYFYVNYTAANPLRTVISRFQVSAANPDSADNNSELILLSYDQPYSNHNGGCLAFGPDGYLYISSGDGGSGGDPLNNAQNITNLLGKIIRIDVNNPQSPLNYGIPSDNPFVDSTNVNVRKEIFAWGLRNPWRMSFDPVTGWLWAADVGQGEWEEIDIIKNGKNYGWRCYEGTHPYNTSGCNGIYEMPVWEYSHSLGLSVTGGYVYRGNNVPELRGKYIYGDYVSARVWALEYDGINPVVNTLITTAAGSITSFGVDEQNELYLVSFNGKIYRFIPTITGVDEETSLNNFVLDQNYPNPFNPTTTISWQTSSGSWNSLKVFDLLGNEVAILVDEFKPAGLHKVEFSPAISNQQLSSGVYFYQLRAGDFTSIKKMVLMK